MARNEEKQLARLNRLLLQNQHDEERKKNPRRPYLSSLNTAADVKKWLPSIKTDLNFSLQQMQVSCYPERKIAEFETQIFHLKGEYKAFVQKLKDLEGNSVPFQEPWIDRPYQGCSHKRALDDTNSELSRGDNNIAKKSKEHGEESRQPLLKRIPLPVLEGDEEELYSSDIKQPLVVWNCDPCRQDEKLEFSQDNEVEFLTRSSDGQQITSYEEQNEDKSSSNQQQTSKDNIRSLNLLVDYSSSGSDCDS